MHQWSTSTYKTISDPVQDNEIFQIQLPRWGMKHDFLFCAIMSLSALEICLAEQGSHGYQKPCYARMGIEYYDKAISHFRQQAPLLSQDQAHLPFIFSSILNIITMAIPQCTPILPGHPKESVKDHITQFMDLVNGSSTLFLANRESVLSGPVSTPVNTAIHSAVDSLTSRMQQDPEGIFTRLTAIVKCSALESPHVAEGTKILDLPVYNRAIKMLRLCYAEEVKPGNNGFCIAFSSLAGPAFIAAFREGEPLALFVALHWAVLLHGLDTGFWWARGVGRGLGEELVGRLAGVEGPFGAEREWVEGLAWAAGKIGLAGRGHSSIEAFLDGWEDS